MNTAEEVKDLYKENLKPLHKDVEKDLENGMTFHAHGLVGMTL